jgi:TrmH family RNA methyltransferase
LLEHCTVVLARTMFGGNAGAAARAVKNTGLGGLRFAAAMYEDHDEAVMFSHGAEDVLEGASRFDRVGEAVSEYRRVVGLTARRRQRRRIVSLREFARDFVAEAMEGGEVAPTALLFGNERDGLTTEELDHCTDLVWIPAQPDHPSYNLAQAVLLVGYELLMARLEQDPEMPRVEPRQTRKPRPNHLASTEQLDELFAHLRTAFLDIGYAYDHTVDPLLRSYREIFSRARLYRREVKMLRGLARQMMWKAGGTVEREGGDVDE